MATFKVRYTELEPDSIRHRVVRNPNYSGRGLSYKGWKEYRLREVRKPELQETLNEDIKNHGFRNPITAFALDEGVYLIFGGSRLRAAQDLQLPGIPAIINDVAEQFQGCPEVTPENVLQFFTDIPPWYEFGEDGFDYHYGLERMRREEWGDSSTGLDWIKGKPYDRAFLKKEMPWLEENGIIMDDTPTISPK
jgi:hypothetical protein